MSRPECVYVTYIATTPDRLWAALTSGAFTRQYWYERRIESDWRVGSPVHFYDGDSATLTDSGVVLECEPPRRLAYSFRVEFDAAARERGYSRVSFTLEPHEGLVKLTLVHDELPDEEMARAFQQGWAPILSSLKTFLETGAPMARLRALEEQGRPHGGAPAEPVVMRTGMLIRRPAAEVFEALVNPDITTQVWFTRSSGRLAPGASVTWEWEMYGASADVTVTAFELNRRVAVEWPGAGGRHSVEWALTPRGDGAAFVAVTESGFAGDAGALMRQVADSTEGFALLLAGLKALLEHGVRLNLVPDRHPAG